MLCLDFSPALEKERQAKVEHTFPVPRNVQALFSKVYTTLINVHPVLFIFLVLQEAVSTGDPELVQLVLQYRDFKRATERLAGIPELLSKLRQVKWPLITCCTNQHLFFNESVFLSPLWFQIQLDYCIVQTIFVFSHFICHFGVKLGKIQKGFQPKDWLIYFPSSLSFRLGISMWRWNGSLPVGVSVYCGSLMKPTQGYNKCICRIGDKNAFPERLVSEPMRLDSSPASAAAELSVLFMKIFFIRI